MRWVSHPLQPHCPSYFREAAELHQFPRVRSEESHDQITSGPSLDFAFERTPNLWNSGSANRSAGNNDRNFDIPKSSSDKDVFNVWDRIQTWSEREAKSTCGTHMRPKWVLPLSELEEAIDGKRAPSRHHTHNRAPSLHSSTQAEHQPRENHAQNHVVAHHANANSKPSFLKSPRNRSPINS